MVVFELRIQGNLPHGLPTKHANSGRQNNFDHSEVVVLNLMATVQTAQYVVLGIDLLVVLGIGPFVVIGIGQLELLDIGLVVLLGIDLLVLGIGSPVLLDIVLDQLVCGEGVGHRVSGDHTVVCWIWE